MKDLCVEKGGGDTLEDLSLQKLSGDPESNLELS